MVVDIVQNVPLHTGTRQRINQKIRCTQQNVHVTQPSYGKMCLDFPVRTQPSLSDHIEKDTGCSWNLSHSLQSSNKNIQKLQKLLPNCLRRLPWQKGLQGLRVKQHPKHTVGGGATKRIGQNCKILKDPKKTQTTLSPNTSPSSKVLSDVRHRQTRASSDIMTSWTSTSTLTRHSWPFPWTSTLPGPREYKIHIFAWDEDFLGIFGN